MQLAQTLQTAIDDAFFENDDYYQTSFRPSLNFKHIHQNKLLGRMQKLFAHASEHHPKFLARAEKGYIYSYQRFVKYNHFNPRFDVKWKRVSLDNLCIHQNVLYSLLLEYLNAIDMARSDHDSYEHDANLVLANRSLTHYYASLSRLRTSKLSTTLMNKNISGVVILFEILR